MYNNRDAILGCDLEYGVPVLPQDQPLPRRAIDDMPGKQLFFASPCLSHMRGRESRGAQSHLAQKVPRRITQS